MSDFNPYIKRIDADSLKELCIRHGELCTFRKGEYLIREGEVYPYFGFIETGIFKYVSVNKTENRLYNTGFAFPGEFVADYQFMTFNPIEGFTFEPGYAYELQVERTTLGNPPADASRYTYKLIDERSKQPVECTRETVRLYVSAETGNYDWGIPQTDDAHCMKIRESENEDWTNVPFNKIGGFIYEDGNAYELSVEKITLHAQPTDNRCQTVQYVLQEIISLHPSLPHQIHRPAP